MTPLSVKATKLSHQKRKHTASTCLSPAFKSTRLSTTALENKVQKKRQSLRGKFQRLDSKCLDSKFSKYNNVLSSSDFLRLICSHLSVKEVLHLICVNRQLKVSILSANNLWKDFIERDFGLKFKWTEQQKKLAKANSAEHINSHWRTVLFGGGRICVPYSLLSQCGTNEFCYSLHWIPRVFLSQFNLVVAQWLGENYYRLYAWCIRCRLRGVLLNADKSLANLKPHTPGPCTRLLHNCQRRVACCVCHRSFCPCTELSLPQHATSHCNRNVTNKRNNSATSSEITSLADVAQAHLMSTLVIGNGVDGEFDVDSDDSTKETTNNIVICWRKPLSFNGTTLADEQSAFSTVHCTHCGSHTCGICYRLKHSFSCCKQSQQWSKVSLPTELEKTGIR